MSHMIASITSPWLLVKHHAPVTPLKLTTPCSQSSLCNPDSHPPVLRAAQEHEHHSSSSVVGGGGGAAPKEAAGPALRATAEAVQQVGRHRQITLALSVGLLATAGCAATLMSPCRLRCTTDTKL